MELSSDSAVASLEMSHTQGQDDGAFISDGESYESLPPHVSVTTHLTAGAVAGVLEHSVMYPVDSVKVAHSEADRRYCSGVLTCPAPRLAALRAPLTVCASS